MNKKVESFPNEVIDELKCYVYRLIDPRNGETFYIGKGKGNRVFNHLKGVFTKESFDEVDDKMQTIREILVAGLDVIHIIHRHGMDEKCALEVEAALIDAYPGVANIMGGHGSNDYGPMNALEIINKYTAQEAIFEHRVLMITVNRSVTERNIYDAVRFAWKVNEIKVRKAEYVFAIKQGIIVGVFIPIEWKPATKDNFPEFCCDRSERYGFVGIEADDSIKALYLQKRVPERYRKNGASNPIKYNF